jgi:hypothetical protein
VRRWWESQDGLGRLAVAVIGVVTAFFAAYWLYVVLFHDFR